MRLLMWDNASKAVTCRLLQCRMEHGLHKLWLSLILLAVACACSPSAMPEQRAGTTQAAPAHDAKADDAALQRSCAPTPDDGVSPSYKPGAPMRDEVGEGHQLTGTVTTSVDCSPIVGAKLELWTEEQGLGHPDEGRAVLVTDAEGRYRFRCNQPEHIHMRISADGFRTIGVNSYHPEGRPEGTFDLVLEPHGGKRS